MDSHIDGLLDEDMFCMDPHSVPCRTAQRVPNTYAPTLPTLSSEYSPYAMKQSHCLQTLSHTSTKKLKSLSKVFKDDVPPNKKLKVDHVEDFLNQITFIASPENSKCCLPGLKSSTKANTNLQLNRVSPLVKKFLDFRCADEKNNSSFINNMSLDKIVDAILDSSDDSVRPTIRHALNSSLIVNVASENDMNESREDNIMNLVKESKVALDAMSRNSSDSGFRSTTTEQSHELANNFFCKCNNNNKENVTIVEMNGNERSVDCNVDSRKRPSSSVFEDGTAQKKIILDHSREDLVFTLKRQKCIRRKRAVSTEQSVILSPCKLNFDSTPIRNCYLETKEIPNGSSSFQTESRDIRKRLLIESAGDRLQSLERPFDLMLIAKDSTIFIDGKYFFLLSAFSNSYIIILLHKGL